MLLQLQLCFRVAIDTVVFQGCYVTVTRVRAVGERTARASRRRVADASPPTPRRRDGRGPSMGEYTTGVGEYTHHWDG